MTEQAASIYATGQRDERPWGDWLVIDVGPGYVVKRIMVRPDQRLSLQRHRHREEHWLVVAGVAEAVLEGQTFRLEIGDRLHVPRGSTHRIANPGSTSLIFVEVQLGTVLSEDDIERLEDVYGRISASGNAGNSAKPVAQ